MITFADGLPTLPWPKWPLSATTRQMVEFILAQGFCLTLVGGGVRSLLTHDEQAIDHALDFEIRHRQHWAGDEWITQLNGLKKAIAKRFTAVKVEEHVYQSCTLKDAAFTIDLTSPRLEHYGRSTGRHGFRASYASDLPYLQAWRRRDFTINAMGFELRRNLAAANLSAVQVQWIDPFNGLQDWQSRKLNILSEDFYLDPVRFLRLVRWLMQGFVPGPNFIEVGRMDLSSLANIHLAQEALKSDFFAYLAKVLRYSRKFKTVLPDWILWRFPLVRWAQKTQAENAKFSSLLQTAEWVAFQSAQWGADFWQFWGLGKAKWKSGQRKLAQLKALKKWPYDHLMAIAEEGEFRQTKAPPVRDLALLKKVKWPWEELARLAISWPVPILDPMARRFWQQIHQVPAPSFKAQRQQYLQHWRGKIRRTALPALAAYAWLICAGISLRKT